MNKNTANDNIVVDHILPFTINETSQRGKIIRLGASLNDIIIKHRYPDSISEILAQLVIIVSMLGNDLKDKGSITAQIRSDGIVDLVIADFFDGNKIRAYARFDEEKLKELKSPIKFSELVGKGSLAITTYFADSASPYQGIVELDGKNLVETLEDYFTRSQQLRTIFKIATKQENGIWHAGGIMLQDMPENQSPEIEESWLESSALTKTLKDSELTDIKLPMADLLYRLFHEQGVWVYEAKNIIHGCKCSKERAIRSLVTIPKEELEEIADNGKIVMKCEFCSTEQVVELGEIG